ncbi:hypothetical protein BB8028_0003g11240 [Beauveria bassiana]|uniref:Ketose-bisphosphate aldolase class-II family protein n=1 Tax=Beauveria bassiana TaxID=176275 RepID=A0A2S7Y8S1_BEABA|nr:hypothetical protein BB8028_0003g11240 [Beauveria bassiana]
MVASFLRAGFAVNRFDMKAAAISKFTSFGPKLRVVVSAADFLKNSAVVILMAQNAAQADNILFGSGNGADALSDHTVVILSSTIPPSFVRILESKLQSLGRGTSLLDAPSRAVLLAMYGWASHKTCTPVQGGYRRGFVYTLRRRLKRWLSQHPWHCTLGLRFEILIQTDAWRAGSWKTGLRFAFYPSMASAAHKLHLNGAAQGWDKEADAGLVRLWELIGISVSSGSANTRPDIIQSAEKSLVRLPAAETLETLPKKYPDDVFSSIQRAVVGGQVPTLVILDDDPTGTQTCHDINVLAVWDTDSLAREFSCNPAGFFILTNSRALPSADARHLIAEICANVKAAAAKADKLFEIVLRGDSTLRGHLPEEPEAVEESLGQFDGWVLAPFFAQGGRLTIDDAHYLKEGDVLVPVSQTPFAQDASFGYKNSNLRQYIVEKCGSRFDQESFLSISLDNIRRGGPMAVAKRLLSAPSSPNLVVIVNAVVDADMHVFVAGLLQAQQHGRRYLFKTGAAFVSSRLAISPIPPLTLEDLGIDKSAASQSGGLVLAGSHVPKTTAQLERLRERRGNQLHVVELPVTQLVSSAGKEAAEVLVSAAAREASETLAAGQDVLVLTSRELVKGTDALSSLGIASKVAQALVALTGGITTRPRYIIAKGGITSSDAATKALGMRRARVLGQAAPGVPLWMCHEETSRHRAVPYVVFPGNVGSDDTLADIVESWAAY